MGCTSSSGAKVGPENQGPKQTRPNQPATAPKRGGTGKEKRQASQDLEWITHDEIGNETVNDLQDVPGSYPPPEPPPYDKDTYIQGVDFDHVDRLANKAPRHLQKDYGRLIKYLTQEQDGDLPKVRAILVWLAKVYRRRLLNNDGQGEDEDGENYSLGGQSKKSFDGSLGEEQHEATRNGVIRNQNGIRTSGGTANMATEEVHTPGGDLDLMNEGQVDIAVLFALCCRKGGIKCAVVRGQWKSDEYEVGDDVVEERLWNSVYLNGVWRLIHPLWSIIRNALSASRDQDQIVIETSKRIHEFDDYYFLTDPEQLITRCFPDDPKWQLLKTPVPVERFKQMPRFTEDFFKLGLSLSRDKDGVLVTTNGKASVAVEFPPSKQPQLYYHISEKESVSEDGSGSSIVMDTDLLRKCVYMFKKEDKYIFKLRFKKKGVYVLKIYGKQVKSVDTEVDHIPLLCQLQIECDDPDRTWRPIPECPAIGWGQSGFAAKLGIVPVSHKGGTAYTNEHRRVNFMFKLDMDVDLQAKLVYPNSYDTLQDLPCKYKGNKVTMMVVLQAKVSEACLRIYARAADSEEFINVCNFIVKLQQLPLEKERARDRRLKNMLEAAMKSGTESMLIRAMEEYAMFIHTDTGELDKAEERLAFLRLRGNLFDAVQREYVPHMEMAIYDAETSKYCEELKSYIRVAKAHLQNLKRTATYRNHVLVLNQSLLLEIRSYMKPKSIIYDVMMAALLLLGENRHDLYEWKYVKGTLSRTGRESILRCMERFDPTRVDSDRVREAETLWSLYTLEQVWEASAGAAVIHKWLSEAISKVKTGQARSPTASEGDKSRFEPTRYTSPETDLIPQQALSSEHSTEGSMSRRHRKRKASGSLADDSDDEVATARQISTEFPDSPRGSRTGSRDVMETSGISEHGGHFESENENENEDKSVKGDNTKDQSFTQDQPGSRTASRNGGHPAVDDRNGRDSN